MDKQYSASRTFLESLNRCEASEQFMPTFYERFLASSEAVRLKFRHTDFDRQHQMLLRSLKLVAGAVTGTREAMRELTDRAHTHDRHHLDIEPRLYDLWRVSLVETAMEFDDAWDVAVERAWQTVLQQVISHMVRHY